MTIEVLNNFPHAGDVEVEMVIVPIQVASIISPIPLGPNRTRKILTQHPSRAEQNARIKELTGTEFILEETPTPTVLPLSPQYATH